MGRMSSHTRIHVAVPNAIDSKYLGMNESFLKNRRLIVAKPKTQSVGAWNTRPTLRIRTSNRLNQPTGSRRSRHFFRRVNIRRFTKDCLEPRNSLTGGRLSLERQNYYFRHDLTCHPPARADRQGWALFTVASEEFAEFDGRKTGAGQGQPLVSGRFLKPGIRIG